LCSRIAEAKAKEYILVLRRRYTVSKE